MGQEVLAAALWVAVAFGLVVVVLLARQHGIANRLRVRNTELEATARARVEEEAHLVSTRLPALAATADHRQEEVPGPLHPAVAGAHQVVLELFAESMRQAKDRGEQSARTAVKAMMRAVQSLANEQQLAISAMQEEHDNPTVLGGLMTIDHMNSQLGRRAQATAVLCGSWPGQQRSASSISDVVRGATSRIRDYLRVQVSTQVDVAVVSRAVEPVVLTVAELLDNGARHSPPIASVQVNFQQAHNGLAIVIDDAGVGMNNDELRHAAEQLSGRAGQDINRLGDPPQVGFAVIGLLAARYGFSVSVDTRSPYGGVRAVIFLPTALLTRVPLPEPVVKRPEARETHATVLPHPSSPRHGRQEEPGTEQEQERTAGGLPKRRRREAPPEVAAQTTPLPIRPASRTTSGLGAWQRGTRSGRAVPPVAEGSPQE
ncbi:ATP-binding protein [Allokutzneria sp. NRRL B-24872]|uniref:ATP-binding protein n=1 Tax=Allokutzneria sp. NRRL B-24872 TaxID=1137961 RepID=UPI000A3853B2|nr:ATP-binding protein [Allokutzneria sp. NRRL B-24872]